MRLVVTGASGFVGPHLVANLIAAKHTVVSCSHKPVSLEGSKSEVFDIRDAARVREVIKRHDPEAVIHLAAQASVPRSWKHPADTYMTNIIGTNNLLESLKDRHGTRVLLVGSAQEYGGTHHGVPFKETDDLEPASPYAVSKVAQEHIGLLYQRQFGLRVLLARAFNHTGPGQSPEYVVGAFCSQIANISRGMTAPTIEVGRLDSVRDFLDVRDVAEAYRRLVESGRPGEAYNVCSGEGHRIGDLLEMLLQISGLSSEVKVVEEAATREGDLDSLVGDNAKFVSATGWRPTIPIRQSLHDTLDWYVGLESQADQLSKKGIE